METRHHVAVQMEKEKQDKLDNGPIVKTADQLWKYSGETEEDSEVHVNYLTAKKYAPVYLKAARVEKPSRKNYHKEYWEKYKLKK
jgi:hypothetical protein